MKLTNLLILKEILNTINLIIEKEFEKMGEQDMNYNPSLIFKIQDLEFFDRVEKFKDNPNLKEIY